MRHIMVLLALASAALAADAPVAEKPPAAVTLAVLDYQAEAPGNPQLGPQMADILTARLSIEDSLALVERASLGKILDEQKLKLVGLADQEQAVQVGKLAGAKLMVIGKAFVMDKKLMIVTKVVGVETGRVAGTIRSVELSKPISEAVGLLAEDVAELVAKKAKDLLPPDTNLPDPLAEIARKLGKRPRAAVAVCIPEEHRAARTAPPVVDPAVETEIKKCLIASGYTVVDTGRNDLADWAREMLKGKKGPWPAAMDKADVVIIGEAFSEFALRTGDLVTCAARAEINVIDRHTGKILLSERHTSRAVDLAENIAAKTALQIAGRKLGVATCEKLLEYTPPAKNPTAPAEPAAKESALIDWHGVRPWEQYMHLLIGETATGPTEKKVVRRTVFAAPFDNATGQEQYDPAAAGMGDLVAVLLAQQEQIAVVERQRLDALTDEQARSLKGLTGEKYAVSAGKLLKADTVLTGRVFLIGGKLTVNAKAIDIASERVLAAGELTCRPDDLPEAALQMARSLAKTMSLPLPEIDLAKIDKGSIASLHFAKALSSYYAGEMDAAIMHLMATLDLDPNFAEASYWSGRAYLRQGEADHAIIELEKFLADAPDAPQAAGARKLLAEAKKMEDAPKKHG